jgi:hypothetical protein
MSFSAPDPLSLAGLSSGLSAVNQTDIPANVRKGNARAKSAYAEGLEFEQVLVQQLAKQLTATVSAGDPSDPSSDSSDPAAGGAGDSQSTDGLLGAGSPAAGYASLIPQALTDSIMSGGGLGVAKEIAQAIDPSINDTTRSTKR